MLPLAGQQLERDTIEVTEEVNLGKVPAIKLLDLGGIFDGRPQDFQKLANRLQAIEDKYDFSIYFVAYSGIIGSGVTEKAELFRDNWLGSQREGLVFVCDTDLRTMAFALTKIEGLPLEAKASPWRLPDHEVMAAMRDLSKVDSTGMSEADYLGAIGHNIAANLEESLSAPPKAAPVLSKSLGAAFILAAALLSWLFWRMQRRGPRDDYSPTTVFPVVETEGRLGASYGGGLVGEISYRTGQEP